MALGAATRYVPSAAVDAAARFYAPAPGEHARSLSVSARASSASVAPPTHAAGSEAEREAIKRELRRFAGGARPSNSTRTYNTYQKQFLSFCNAKGWDAFDERNRDVYSARFLMARSVGPKALSGKTLTGPVSGALYDLYRWEDGPAPTQSAAVREVKKTIKLVAPLPRKAKAPLPIERLRAAVQCARADKQALRGARDACIMLFM